MKKIKGVLAFCFVLMMIVPHHVFGQKTHVMIRAKAKDAKFIGSSIGGAQIIVTNAMTDAIMAEGMTYGSTGNTALIMKTPQQRRERLTDHHTAGFLAALDITEPTLVNIEAIAPKNARSSRVSASVQVWVIPGKDIMGDGIVVEIPGFIVDILSPQRHRSFLDGEMVEIKANITMMCGCGISKDGVWDADDYEVKALIYKRGKQVNAIDLRLVEKSTFLGRLQLKAGMYELMVYAYDAKTGNTGVARTNIEVK